MSEKNVTDFVIFNIFPANLFLLWALLELNVSKLSLNH